MSKAQKFEDLTIFQKAHELCKEVYAITKEGEFHKDVRFVQQIHASAGSVMDNIAEGFESTSYILLKVRVVKCVVR